MLEVDYFGPDLPESECGKWNKTNIVCRRIDTYKIQTFV